MAAGNLTNGNATGSERAGWNDVDIATNVAFPSEAQGAIASWDGTRQIMVYQAALAVWAYNSSSRYGRLTLTGGGITSVTSGYINLPNGGTGTGTPGLFVFDHANRVTTTNTSFNVNVVFYTNTSGTRTNGSFGDADDTRIALRGTSNGTANNQYRAAIYWYSVPDAPTSITANSNNGPAPSSVTYTAPGNGGNAITSYTTIWQTSNTWSTAGGWSSGNPALGSFASNTVYYFNVIATNGVGDSPYGTAASWFYRTITFNANGGSSTPSTLYPNNGGALNLPAAISRTGYTFAGWNTNSLGTGTNYSAGSSYTASGDVTLYAKWTPNTYTLSLDANGGTVTPTSQSETYNSAIGTIPTPTRTGYTFNGWFTAASGGTLVTSATIYTTVGDSTIYAQWTAITYSIDYNSNGGSGTMSTTSWVYPGPATISTNSFTRPGYIFSGWNTAANGSGTSYANGGSYSTAANLLLYAQWTAVVPKIYSGTSFVPATGSKIYNGSSWVSPTFKVYNGSSWVDPT
jgi:uncharacterized repeat protein (TIGR02543 family)